MPREGWQQTLGDFGGSSDFVIFLYSLITTLYSEVHLFLLCFSLKGGIISNLCRRKGMNPESDAAGVHHQRFLSTFFIIVA